MLTKEQGDALVKVLSLAENHQMWSSPMATSPAFKQFTDDQYAAIQEVRKFLKENGVVTMHELMQRAYEKSKREGED